MTKGKGDTVKKKGTKNYSVLDQPEVSGYLFHPRVEPGLRPTAKNRDDMMIPVDEAVQVAAS